MAPLTETPERDDGNPVEQVIARVLNPKFINEQLYDLLMDRKLTSEHAGFIAYGDLKNKLGLTRDEQKLVVQMLQEHMVAFEYEHAGMPKGLLVPDRFPERGDSDYPEEDSSGLRAVRRPS